MKVRVTISKVIWCADDLSCEDDQNVMSDIVLDDPLEFFDQAEWKFEEVE